MTSALLFRRLRVPIAAVLFSAVSSVTLQAEPIRVTSGFFYEPEDGPPYFEFFGTDGFTLIGFRSPVLISPRVTCHQGGCTSGTLLDMSMVAGGDQAGGSLGEAQGAIVNGTEFLPLGPPFDSLPMRGTLRFEAPVIRLSDSRAATAPFNLTGQVSVFARDDLDFLAPLFAVDLVGQGTLRLSAFALPDEVFATYTFATDPPVPEPATVILFGTGLAGMVARAWKRKRASEAR